MNYQLDKRLGQQLLGMIVKQIGTSPLFIWGGLLTLLLSVASIATQELTSPGPIEPAEIAASPVQSEESATLSPQPPDRVEGPTSVQSSTVAVEISPQTDNALPLWLFGAIAIGCASGSWFISQQINRRQKQADPIGAVGTGPSLGQVRRPRRPTMSRTTIAGRPATSSGRVMSRRDRDRAAAVTRVGQQTRRSQTPLTPEGSRATIRRRSYMTGQLQQALKTHGPQKEEVQVRSTLPPKQKRNVVVPRMENPSSDRALGREGKRGQKSLAEMMDIRKRQSVASVVRNI